MTNARYDVNQDGALDIDDVQAVASNWQLSIPGPCNRLTKRYYRLGGQLIAVRTNGELNYLHGDHLGSVSLLTDAAGQKVRGGEQRFHPFGTVRTGQPAFYPTERGYTGQRLDLSTDLMYYEARYYDPLLGRFVQADTIVPGAGGSQGLNRFGYSSNGPTTTIDPTGHCPQPAGIHAYSNVICVAGFIPTETSTAIPLIVYFRGDDRDFSSASDSEGSRFSLWISTDTGTILWNFVHSTQRVSGPRGENVGNPSPPRNDPQKIAIVNTVLGSNWFETTKGDDGTITLSYHVVCSDTICNNLLAPDGTITFTPNENGSYYASGTVNKFPNLEAYHWKNGVLQNEYLLRRQYFSANELRDQHAEWRTGFGMAIYEHFDTRPADPRWHDVFYALVAR